VKDYSDTATAANGEISGTVEEMAEHYGTLVGKVEGLDEAEGNLADAVDEVTAAVGRLNEAEQTHYEEEWGRIQDLINQYKQLAIERELGITGKTSGNTYEYDTYDQETAIREGTSQDRNNKQNQFQWTITSDPLIQAEDDNGNLITYGKVTNGLGDYAYMRVTDTDTPGALTMSEWQAGGKTPGWEYFDLYWINNGVEPKKAGTPKYAKGGYVDYTGPAWVDGTKSHPEYMLNATQTAQFESLVDALSMTYKSPNFSQAKVANAEKTGDTRMEFHINVEGISNDYDVDRAVERIEKKILDSGKYRNTTVLKNSN
jgi:hypothetical protein